MAAAEEIQHILKSIILKIPLNTTFEMYCILVAFEAYRQHLSILVFIYRGLVNAVLASSETYV